MPKKALETFQMITIVIQLMVIKKLSYGHYLQSAWILV